MPLIYLKGTVNVQTFEQKCKETDLNPAEVVFLFPGNSSHHSEDNTLFSIKIGEGLAKAARLIGQKGYPTLSIPTTSMELWSSSLAQQVVVHKAIQDLYRALGAGFSFILPVRDHTPVYKRIKETQYYFDTGLNFNSGLEPSFWGGIQSQANAPLAKHYIESLNEFVLWIDLPDEIKEQLIKNNPNNPLYKAYEEGRKMATDHLWLTPVVKAAPPAKSGNESEKTTKSDLQAPIIKPTIFAPPKSSDESKKLIKKPQEIVFPATYAPIYNSEQTPLQSARALLDDYTKGNSAISRFFHGRWNLHHIEEVNQIVEDIDGQKIKDMDALVVRLHGIRLVNPVGSLSRRILFIEKEFASVDVTNEQRIPQWVKM